MKNVKNRSKFHEKMAVFLPLSCHEWQVRGPKEVFSSYLVLVKVSWKSDAWKCQNQVTSPYFYQLSERHQPLFVCAIWCAFFQLWVLWLQHVQEWKSISRNNYFMSNLSQLHLKIGVHISPRISKLTSNATLADVIGTGRATKTGEFSEKF